MQGATLPPVLRESNVVGAKLFRRGKVRDVYDLGANLLMVASDRLSAFDVVLPQGIPGKGVCLTQISNHWFRFTEKIVPNHLVETDFERFPPELRRSPEVRGRSVLVRKTKPLAIECIVRGYIAGSGWKDYQKSGAICGIKLPTGLKEASKLPEPIFTPSTKAEQGHDVNITEAEAGKVVGADTFAKVREASLRVYQAAADDAAKKGIIIADTKFEFGLLDGKLFLIDEVLTPDSSRFWPADQYRPGSSPPSFDKQFVRDYLESIKWNKQPPAPNLPAHVIEGTTQRYLEAYRRLTGKPLRF
ncbi:MAG: phosphoribosylaminoimidazolesuccinocarboxamide synthase [Euryarchaeota archaeon]|nr:phosphoribosylaminoimidazolesuccinocarboxamide synthase [Euryarchaeota archaeon]